MLDLDDFNQMLSHYFGTGWLDQEYEDEPASEVFPGVRKAWERMDPRIRKRGTSLLLLTLLYEEMDPVDRHRHHWVNYYLLDWPAQYKHGLKSIEEETRDDATKDKIELALGAVKDNEDFAKLFMEYLAKIFAPASVLSFEDLEAYLFTNRVRALIEGLLVLVTNRHELGFFERWNRKEGTQRAEDREAEYEFAKLAILEKAAPESAARIEELETKLDACEKELRQATALEQRREAKTTELRDQLAAMTAKVIAQADLDVQTANHQAQLAAANQRTVAADGRAVVADERIAELEARVQSLSREYQDDDHHLSQARTHLDKFVAKRPDWSEMGFDDDEADVRSEKRRRT